MHQKFLKLISFMLVVSLLLSVVTTSNFPSLIVSQKKVYQKTIELKKNRKRMQYY